MRNYLFWIIVLVAISGCIEPPSHVPAVAEPRPPRHITYAEFGESDSYPGQIYVYLAEPRIGRVMIGDDTATMRLSGEKQLWCVDGTLDDRAGQSVLATGPGGVVYGTRIPEPIDQEELANLAHYNCLPVEILARTGFTWNPFSDSDRRLVVILPGSWGRRDVEVAGEHGAFKGIISGGRAHYRLRHAGSYYGKNVKLKVGTECYSIPDGGVRYD